jgi:hypothetical protein
VAWLFALLALVTRYQDMVQLFALAVFQANTRQVSPLALLVLLAVGVAVLQVALVVLLGTIKTKRGSLLASIVLEDFMQTLQIWRRVTLVLLRRMLSVGFQHVLPVLRDITKTKHRSLYVHSVLPDISHRLGRLHVPFALLAQFL